MKFLSRALPLILLAGVSMADTGAEPRQSLTNDAYNEHEPLALREAATVNKDEDTRQRSASIGALSDPTRLGILALLIRHEELCVCDLEAVLDITQSKTSRHLSYLANAGLVTGERNGQWMHYRVSPDMAPEARAVLRQLRQLLPEQQIERLNRKLDSWLTSKHTCNKSKRGKRR